MTGRLSLPERIHWRVWDGAAAVYDDRSGETHYVDALGAIVFAVLASAPCGLAELQAKVFAELEVDAAPEHIAALEQVIAKLRETGLIADDTPRS